MSSFTTTRHELITECGPSQQMNPPLHFDAQSFDDCINEAMYSSNAIASEASSFLPLENLSLFDNQWSPPINFDYFESYIQDSTDCKQRIQPLYLHFINYSFFKVFFSYNNVMKNETSFPVEENVTPVCRSAVYPTCTELDVLSTIDHHSPKADHINHAFTAAGTAGGKLTWFQSIPFENKNKPKDERKQKDGYVNWTSSAPILKLTGPVHSDFTYPITDESPPEGASYIPTVVSSASEPIPNRLSYSRHSLSESRKCTPRYDSYSHPIKLNPSSKDRRQREPVHFSTPNNPQDNFSDSYDHFEPTPNMLAAMPRRQKLRYEGDYYTPKWVRYTGHLKQGYCDSCVPGKWLQLKNSAYW